VGAFLLIGFLLGDLLVAVFIPAMVLLAGFLVLALLLGV
jgi:hypothetical protein